MAYVDLNEFTKCMNAYESIVSALQNQIEALGQANSTLKMGITGAEGEALYANCKSLQAQVEANISQLKKAIALVQSTNKYYVTNLGVLE